MAASMGTPAHQSHGTPPSGRGPLEPPKISKPWSLSCLRPAPPLKPSAALGYKEVAVPGRSLEPWGNPGSQLMFLLFAI